MHHVHSQASVNFQSVSARSFRMAWTLDSSQGSVASFLITVSSDCSSQRTSGKYFSRCYELPNRRRTTTAQCSVSRKRQSGCPKLSLLAQSQGDPCMLLHSRARQRPRSLVTHRVAEGTQPILLGLRQAALEDYLALGTVLAAVDYTPILNSKTGITLLSAPTGTSLASVSMPPRISRRCGRTARRGMFRTRRGRT